LAGETLDGWEPRDTAVGRVCGAIEQVLRRHAGQSVGVVSHGIALTLYLSSVQGLNPEAAFRAWSSIRMPDVAVVEDGRTVQPFGG
jgi:broad specificity phosphatase PhoE